MKKLHNQILVISAKRIFQVGAIGGAIATMGSIEQVSQRELIKRREVAIRWINEQVDTNQATAAYIKNGEVFLEVAGADEDHNISDSIASMGFSTPEQFKDWINLVLEWKNQNSVSWELIALESTTNAGAPDLELIVTIANGLTLLTGNNTSQPRDIDASEINQQKLEFINLATESLNVVITNIEKETDLLQRSNRATGIQSYYLPYLAQFTDVSDLNTTLDALKK